MIDLQLEVEEKITNITTSHLLPKILVAGQSTCYFKSLASAVATPRAFIPGLEIFTHQIRTTGSKICIFPLNFSEYSIILKE